MPIAASGAQGRDGRAFATRGWVVDTAKLSCLLLAIVAASARSADAQGVYLPSIGPTNQSFGGAATAAPIDLAGALYWNPATLSGLKKPEFEIPEAPEELYSGCPFD